MAAHRHPDRNPLLGGTRLSPGGPRGAFGAYRFGGARLCGATAGKPAEMGEQKHVKIREMVRALRASWWLPALGLVLGALAAIGLTAATTPVYTSSTQLFVSTTDVSSTSDALQGNQFAQARVTSYAQLFTSPQLTSRVVDRLRLSMTPDRLASEITATAVPETVVLDVSVTDVSAARARNIAQTVSSEFISLVNELETPTGATVSPVKVSIVAPAELPRSPSAPLPMINLAAGVALGLLCGAGIAIARAQLDRSVKDSEQAAELAGAPVIGTLLRDTNLRTRCIASDSNDRSAEAYRRLQTNLQFLDVDQPPRILMITSAVPAEGKTTVAANLALALADSGQRVVIVEADMRRPRATSYLGLIGDVGLTNVLVGRAELEDVLQPYGDGALMVLAAGPAAPNPAQLLASGSMAALLEKLRASYDYVIVDAPPLLPVADSTGLAVLTDGALLVVRHGSTTTEQVRQARATLDRVGATTFGVVLNIVPARDDVSSAYGYEYSRSRQSQLATGPLAPVRTPAAKVRR